LSGLALTFDTKYFTDSLGLSESTCVCLSVCLSVGIMIPELGVRSSPGIVDERYADQKPALVFEKRFGE